jgi:hypothetical protein
MGQKGDEGIPLYECVITHVRMSTKELRGGDRHSVAARVDGRAWRPQQIATTIHAGAAERVYMI